MAEIERIRGIEFSGKVALITGSSSGIGAATAILLAKYGAQVVVTGRNQRKISEVSQKCYTNSQTGYEPLEIVADLTKDEDCARLVQMTIDYFGRLDILVNNAGMGAMTSIGDPSLMSVYDSCMNIDLRAVVYLTHLAVPHIIESRGTVINVSSISGLRPLTLVYSMAKCALNMFTMCLAAELGPKGVRVNSVNPASVRTQFAENMGFEENVVNSVMDRYSQMFPLRRVGEPVDIANAIIFIASSESSFTTGINFVVDGGALYGTNFRN